MLNAPDYLLSVVALGLVLGPLALGAVRVRKLLLSGWSGLPAHVGDVVLTLGLLVLTAELIGTVGYLQRWWLVAASLVVGVGLRFLVPEAEQDAGRPPPAPPGGVWGTRVAALIAAVLVAHWSIGMVAAYGTGMTGYDSAWYHMPFAAHFAQSGSTLDFVFVSPRYLSWFYPQNSELLHGVGMLLTGRDMLSPALNLLWMIGCLGAAWCIGRPYGLGSWTVAAAAIVLDSGLMADQAGEARNDTLALFFLLAAVAFIVNGAAAGGRSRLPSGPLALAGLAAGLAAGTKLTFLAPVAVLAIALPFLAASGRRRVHLAASAAPILAGCGFWYLRNLFAAGNPLPWLKAIGPLQFEGPDQGLGGRHQSTLLHYVGDGRVWNDWFEPGLGHRLGELWPIVLGVVVLTVMVALIRAPWTLKVIAVAAVAGAFAYLVDGTSAEGPLGSPVGFASSLRHLLPAICLGLVLMPLLPRLSSLRGRTGSAVVLAVLLAGADRSANPWPPGYLAVAVLLGAAALAVVVAQRLPLRARLAQPAYAAEAATALVAVLVGGWFVQRSYLSERYAGEDFRSPGLNAAFAWASRQHDQRIATTLSILYPLYGTDLSNRVQHLGLQRPDGGFTKATSCSHWLAAVNRGRFDYLVVNDRPGLVDRDERTFAHTDAQLVFERKLIEVFRIEGPLRRSACSRIHREPGSTPLRRPAESRNRS
jgi:hypothetical protein